MFRTRGAVERSDVRAARQRQAGDFMHTARCLEQEGKLREAVAVLEEGLRGLSGTERSRELNLMRADLLLRMGRATSAIEILSSLPLNDRVIELLEREGLHGDAVRLYLEQGRIEEASRVALRAPNPERLHAQILLRTGRPAEAGHLLARQGLTREAAEAYELAEDWSRAAYRWEAAGELLRAAEAYEKARRPRDAARCYMAAGMPERAAKLSSPGSRPDPPKGRTARPNPNLEAARRSLAAGDKARAASLLLQIQRDEADFAAGTLLLVPLLIEEGFCREALDRLRTMPLGGEAAMEIERHYLEGRCLAAMGQKGDAIACFEWVLERAPGYRETAQRLDELRPPVPAARPAGPAQEVTAELPVVGRVLAGRYEIAALLGQGGMGRVYKAHDLELDEAVAIKTVLTSDGQDPAEQTRLLREIQICRRISHPNVVRTHDIGRFPGGLFITMEYIEGRDLHTLIAEEKPLPFARIRFLLSEIAAGLHEAHCQGVIHRDLKPDNVLVTESRVKILDFGIAAMSGLGARITQAGFVMGTPMYISPDQILGQELDGRSDLYSLGLIAYSLIAGRDPYDLVEPSLLLIKQLHETPRDVRKWRPETPEPWVELLGRLLAKNPEDRYQTGQEVLDVLAKLPL